MTYRVAFTRRAQADLHGLFDYLADRFGMTNAQLYVEQIEKTCLSLDTMPNRGTERSDLRPGLRIMGYLRILYGGRSVELAFPQDDD
jgi:toxin ParE1/3/4